MRPAPKPAPKPKGKPRRKKTPRQLIVRDLDTLVREIVFSRDAISAPLYYGAVLKDNGAVEYAMKHSGIDHPGHVISRAKMGVRWDLLNVHRQDANDNLLHEYYPEVYITWFITQFGILEWERMVNDSRVISKYSMDDLETLYIELVEIQKWQNISGKPAYFAQKDILSGVWRS